MVALCPEKKDQHTSESPQPGGGETHRRDDAFLGQGRAIDGGGRRDDTRTLQFGHTYRVRPDSRRLDAQGCGAWQTVLKTQAFFAEQTGF